MPISTSPQQRVSPPRSAIGWSQVLGVVVCLGLLMTVGSGTAFAIWPFPQKKPRPVDTATLQAPLFMDADATGYPPPDKDTLKRDCEPYRRKVQTMTQRNWLYRSIFLPRIGLTKRKHYQCMQRFMTAEKQYIEHNILLPDQLVKEAPKPTFEDLENTDVKPVHLPETPPGQVKRKTAQEKLKEQE